MGPEPDGAGLEPALAAALGVLSRTQTLLVALDFDGVLSPLVRRAEDARPLPGSAAAVRALSRLPRTTTALISGRALASLREAAGPEPQTLLIGSHGAETWTGPEAPPLVLSDEQAALLAEATAVVQSVVAAHPGTRLEPKPAGVVLHTRTATDSIAAAATAAARQRLEHLNGLHLMDGKRVLESSVVHTDKGEGLALLRKLTGATAVFFAGDDVTDERAFERLAPQDVGVKVGPGATAAGYRVDSPQQFQGVLELLLRLRTAAVNG